MSIVGSVTSISGFVGSGSFSTHAEPEIFCSSMVSPPFFEVVLPTLLPLASVPLNSVFITDGSLIPAFDSDGSALIVSSGSVPVGASAATPPFSGVGGAAGSETSIVGVSFSDEPLPESPFPEESEPPVDPASGVFTLSF